jgi:hypothetical protein
VNRAPLKMKVNVQSDISVQQDAEIQYYHNSTNLPTYLPAKLLAGLSTTVILGSGSHGTHEYGTESLQT